VLSFVTPSAGGFTLGTEQSATSGTSITFGSIPSGTKMIIIMFESISMTDTSNYLITIGDSAGLETSAYGSGAMQIDVTDASTAASTAGFTMMGDASNATSGLFIMTLKDSANNTWAAGHSVGYDLLGRAGAGGGVKSLSAELTQLQISGGTFDGAGSFNIMYQ
jgi:hypothetical protein